MADNLTLDRHAMKDRATSHLRIYVGGITDSATIDDLYEHFIQFGTINGIVVNRNFGFVQFEEESSAQLAISKANGSIFQGKNINVRTAQQNPDKRRETEVVTIQPDVPPAVALTDNTEFNEEGGEDQYDSYGNYVEKYEEEYDDGAAWNIPEPRGGARGRAPPRGRGRGARGRGGPAYPERSPLPTREWSDRYEHFATPEYPRAMPVPERNDCEIIVVAKSLTEYAEYIEGRLKRLGIVVDLLFPMEDVPIGKVLGNIASRGCLYAILVMPQNMEHRSLTLTILHGLPQEHRNMPLEDALALISRNFQEVRRGGAAGREAVYALLGQLADGRALTAMQYDKVLEYLQERREQQVKVELGEPLPSTNTTSKTEENLQKRILNILNEKKLPEPVAPPPAPAPVPSPDSKIKLLSDPSVRKALDSILNKFT